MKATAIITHLKAVTAETIQASVDKANATRDAAVQEYETALDRNHVSAETRAAFETGKLLLGGGIDSYVQNCWIRLKKEKAYAFAAADKAKHLIPKPERIKIAVINSYEIKDALKTAGYRFDPAGYWVDFLGMQVKAAWVKVVPMDVAADALAALVKIGVEIKLDSDLNTILNPANI